MVAISDSSAAGPSHVLARRLTVIACLAPIFVLFILVMEATQNGEMVRAFFYDDFYYYAEVARHIKETGLSSFDGVTLTNGYQPLWMAVLIAISFFVSIRPGT